MEEEQTKASTNKTTQKEQKKSEKDKNGIIGGISENVISICLTFAAGAMLYIVSGELIPESNSLYKGKFPTIGNIIGFILGLIAVNI